jgi:hypothetical protein
MNDSDCVTVSFAELEELTLTKAVELVLDGDVEMAAAAVSALLALLKFDPVEACELIVLTVAVDEPNALVLVISEDFVELLKFSDVLEPSVRADLVEVVKDKSEEPDAFILEPDEDDVELLEAVTGWLVVDSPDLVTFASFAISSAVFVSAGLDEDMFVKPPASFDTS